MLKRWIELASDRRGFEVAAGEAPDIVNAFRESSEYKAIQAVWEGHANGIGADRDICEQVASLPTHIRRLYLLSSNAFAETVCPSLPKSPRPTVLDLDWNRLRKNIDELLSFQGGYLQGRLDSARFVSEVARQTVLETERFCAFQDRTIETRELRVPDPLSGFQKATRDSYHTYGRGVYMFAGDRLFYLITGGAGHKATAFYIPSARLIIDLRAGNEKIMTPDVMATTFSAQIKRLAENNNAFISCLSVRENEISKKEVVLMAGQIENFAHHIWNFYPGIEKIINAGNAKNVDSVYSFGSEFFGDFSLVYPEFGDRHTHRPRSALQSQAPFDPSVLLFQAGGYFITEELKQRLLQTSSNSSAMHPVADVPYVWFGLRVGSRTWADQVHAIPEIMKAVLAEEPRTQFILDGFSYPVGQDAISTKWAAAIEEISSIADQIKAVAPAGSVIIDLVGKGLDDAIVYASCTTVYVAPIGTTQHKVGWFTKGKGIIYSGPSILATREARRPGCWEAENIEMPHYVIGKTLESGQRRSINDTRRNLENISLDTAEIARCIVAAVLLWSSQQNQYTKLD